MLVTPLHCKLLVYRTLLSQFTIREKWRIIVFILTMTSNDDVEHQISWVYKIVELWFSGQKRCFGPSAYLGGASVTVTPYYILKYPPIAKPITIAVKS